MGQAIEHRNIGQLQTYADKNLWVQKAKEIESAAVSKAKELSPTAGSLVEWLDKVTPWNVNSDVDKYISILSAVIERIRGLMERNSYVFYSDPSNWNSIANLQLLNAIQNESKLASPLNDWVTNNNIDKSNQLIPDVSLDISDF